MTYVTEETSDGIATLTLSRGKVNAVNMEVLAAITASLESARADGGVRAVVLTGRGRFFSFGFDVPWLYDLPREACGRFVTEFSALLLRLYTYPKPVVAALNGHTIAGGCMLALACDRRIMAREAGKISLNEVTFGSTVFAAPVAMLRAVVGTRIAEQVLLSGAMYAPDEALALGLVDEVVAPEVTLSTAGERARELAAGNPVAFAHLKRLVRGPVLEEIRSNSTASIEGFLNLWYSPSAREQLRGIEIRK